MELKIDTQTRVNPGQTETYMAFRSSIPKPVNEGAHLRHILRFYMVRAMQKGGEQNIYVLPQLVVGEKQIRVDVAAGMPGKYTLSICEPGSVTPETEDILDFLKDIEGIDVILVHSQYGNPGNVLVKFNDQLQSKRFQLLAVAIPHADPDHVSQSAVCIGILNSPVPFAQMGTDGSTLLDVHLVFLLAIKEREKQVEMIQQLVQLIQTGSLLEQLTRVEDPAEALTLIQSTIA